jgi:hypothetical protein
VELENHPDAFKAFQIAERRFEIPARGKLDAPRMSRKKTPLSRSVIFVNGIAVKYSDWLNLHYRPSSVILP